MKRMRSLQVRYCSMQHYNRGRNRLEREPVSGLAPVWLINFCESQFESGLGSQFLGPRLLRSPNLTLVRLAQFWGPVRGLTENTAAILSHTQQFAAVTVT